MLLFCIELVNLSKGKSSMKWLLKGINRLTFIRSAAWLQQKENEL
jgi:hypothetical protein